MLQKISLKELCSHLTPQQYQAAIYAAVKYHEADKPAFDTYKSLADAAEIPSDISAAIEPLISDNMTLIAKICTDYEPEELLAAYGFDSIANNSMYNRDMAAPVLLAIFSEPPETANHPTDVLRANIAEYALNNASKAVTDKKYKYIFGDESDFKKLFDKKETSGTNDDITETLDKVSQMLTDDGLAVINADSYKSFASDKLMPNIKAVISQDGGSTGKNYIIIDKTHSGGIKFADIRIKTYAKPDLPALKQIIEDTAKTPLEKITPDNDLNPWLYKYTNCIRLKEASVITAEKEYKEKYKAFSEADSLETDKDTGIYLLSYTDAPYNDTEGMIRLTAEPKNFNEVKNGDIVRGTGNMLYMIDFLKEGQKAFTKLLTVRIKDPDKTDPWYFLMFLNLTDVIENSDRLDHDFPVPNITIEEQKKIGTEYKALYQKKYGLLKKYDHLLW